MEASRDSTNKKTYAVLNVATLTQLMPMLILL